jgi:hypothetical protein
MFVTGDWDRRKCLQKTRKVKLEKRNPQTKPEVKSGTPDGLAVPDPLVSLVLLLLLQTQS